MQESTELLAAYLRRHLNIGRQAEIDYRRVDIEFGGALLNKHLCLYNISSISIFSYGAFLPVVFVEKNATLVAAVRCI